MTDIPRAHRVTIADVAREAGVSRTTVSHALSGQGKVNADTRAKVKEVAERLNYRPSARARSLRSGKSQTLALLSSMPAAVSAGPSQLGFFTELAMGCARTALLEGYVFVLAPHPPRRPTPSTCSTSMGRSSSSRPSTTPSPRRCVTAASPMSRSTGRVPMSAWRRTC
jgi:transcriptional regulator with XRE-family HTH domain